MRPQPSTLLPRLSQSPLRSECRGIWNQEFYWRPDVRCNHSYATSTSSNACKFVRAISVACAQLPRKTKVIRPCVLLPVGS